MERWGRTPTLRGEHVLLRPTLPSDATPLAVAHDDDATLEFFPHGIDSEPPSPATLAHMLAAPGRQTLTQIDLGSGAVIGTTALYNLNPERRCLTIGYTWLSSSARGKPFNAEAKLLLLTHSFETLEAVRVEFNVDDRNTRSRRAVLALGTSQEGILRKHARRREGSWRDTVVFSIVDDEWPAVYRRLTARVNTLGSPLPEDRPSRWT
ncbi:GNAT family N-acetyltransferase [Frankia sp. AgB32]|uniref:GNAT family N-acetyltransferase n=1 Tax=Frankia sp. AgB32 TaxID=631119 RepID=UPI00200FDFE4|nr:GNAT family protein [Frankia sp. AgB32]MCK9896179.1 GNAT family N-acetyltransferase [Frankia sp. AgB32]